MTSDPSGVAVVQTVFLVTKEVDLGTYQETLLEMQDVVQVRRSRFTFRCLRLLPFSTSASYLIEADTSRRTLVPSYFVNAIYMQFFFSRDPIVVTVK